MTALTLTRTQAAALCCITPSGFDHWVRRGIVPPPIAGTRRWSRVQLERALAGQSWIPPESATSTADVGETAYSAWSLKEDERDKHRPLFKLNARHERTLRILIKLGTSNGNDIEGAGEATFRHLVATGLAEKNADVWIPTIEGRAEIERIHTWLHWHDR